jgi:hypothetical protein
MMSQTKTIHERSFALPKGEATNDNPVVPGVKVLGIESKNGRRYPLEVMKNALEKYEGAIVNIDHPAGSEPRSYEDRFGRLTNARMESDGIYADLAYNPKHPLAEGFQWWVKNDPKAIGLSHNAQAKTKMNEQDGVEEIEEIVAVDSVDLVAEPATTAGLLEAVMRKDSGSKEDKKSEAWTPPKHEKLDMVYNKAHGEFKKIMDEIKKIVAGTSQEKLIRASSMKLQEFLNELDDASKVLRKTNESAKGNRMNVMEGEKKLKESFGPVEKVINEFAKDIGEAFYNACKSVPRTGVPKEWYGSLDHGLGKSSSPWYKMINDARNLAEKMYKDYVDRVEDHRAEAKRRGMTESKPSKKLNVAEAPMTPKQKSIADKKAFIASVMKKQAPVSAGINKDEYPPIPGMEGPFKYRNGQILYYDPKEGKYYDRKTDMYQSRAPESVQRKVAEAKRRKAIRRKLVAEALKEIFSVKKGV